MKFKTTVSSEIRDKAFNEGMQAGIEKGIEKGIEQGIEQGKVSNLVNNIIALTESLHCNVEEAMNLLKVDSSIKPTVLNMLEQFPND